MIIALLVNLQVPFHFNMRDIIFLVNVTDLPEQKAFIKFF